MKLIRLALLTLGHDPKDAEGISLEYGPVSVGPLLKTVVPKTFLLPAAVDLERRPKISKEGMIRVPDKQREVAEEAIEHFANAVAVVLHCDRKISSPEPPVALFPQTEQDHTLLASAKGFLSKTANRSFPTAAYRLDPKVDFQFLLDRLDGAAFVAEALCHEHSTGRFHEIVRLFERAFGLSGRKLSVPLSQYLSAAEDFGYTTNEVTRWVDIRDGVTHADRRNDLLFEADVAWVTGRVMQAAYDVLLNKRNWRKQDCERRNVWRPITGTTSPDADMFLVKGPHGWQMSMQVFDEFRRFPSHLGGVLKTLPKGWWSKRPAQAKLTSGTSKLLVKEQRP